MNRQKRAPWQILAGFAILVAMISMACGLSVNAPRIQVPNLGQPTFTSQAPRNLPTLPPPSNNNDSSGTLATQAVTQPATQMGTQAVTLAETPAVTLAVTPAVTPAVTSAATDVGQIPATGANSPVQPPSNLADVYDQANPGTVSILVQVSSGAQQGEGAGSGFVLTQDGYIATNYHVAGDASTIIVRFFNGVDVRAKLVGGDPDSDLAIVKVDQLPQGVHPLPLGDSTHVRVGEGVVAIGNPFALGTSMSYGIVSAIGRTISSISQSYNIPQAIQTDAAINPGNSGGPLINMAGQVIGINAQIRTSGTSDGNIGIGFAIPVNILKTIYPDLIKNGSYTWPYLGVASPQASPMSINLDNPQTTQGAVISEVTQGGPAEQAGLAASDVVTSADGQKITSFDTLLSYIMSKRPGDQIKLGVLRNNQQGEVTVTLGTRPHGDNTNQ